MIPLLERAHDDLAASQFALATLPVHVLVPLHEQVPECITRDALEKVLLTRVTAEQSWAIVDGTDRLPAWIAPFVVERLRHCGDEEARALFAWLVALPEGATSRERYELAVGRFERTPFEEFWHSQIGRCLSTGASWREQGRSFIELCIEGGRGFPAAVLHAALDSAALGHGASAEEHQRAILKRVHEETAKLLVARAERALRAGDHPGGDLFLSALISLDPGSFVGGALRRIGKIPVLPAEIVLRIDACAELVKASGRAPTADAFLEAFLVLTGHSS